MLGSALHLVALTTASDPVPAENNVVAGWVGAAVLGALVIALVIILRSFTKQLKKVNQAADAGVYDEPSDSADDQTSSTVDHDH